jgi:hypothetical protein
VLSGFMALKLYVWRHNRTFHSYSMINEPCVHQDFYCDAVAVVLARDEREALELLERRGGWRADELSRLEPVVYDTETAAVIFADVRG